MINPERLQIEQEPVSPPEGEEEIFEERETIPVPEVTIQPERGVHLMSLMLKGYNPEWGDRDHELSKLTEQYFEKRPLNQEVKDFLNEIKALEDRGVDEESLYNLSLSYQHPERTKEVFDFLKKYKDIPDPEDLQRKCSKALEILESDLNSDPAFQGLEKKFEEENGKDIKLREGQLEKSRERIKELIDYFRPKPETSPIEKVNLLPTDFLYPKKSGKSFSYGKEVIVKSPIGESLEDTLGGQTHEFLHGVVNPIIDKLEKILTEDQKKKIIQGASGRLKQHYGEEHYSLLCEELIRTYTNIFAKKRKPLITYKDFQRAASQATEDQFQKSLAEDKEARQRYESLGISSLEKLKNSKEYFEKYEKDEIGEKVFALYKKFDRQKQQDPNTCFEDFLMENYQAIFD